MSYTSSQWSARALQKAGIVAEDATPTADESSWASDIGTALFKECVAQGIKFPGGSYASLPDEYYDAFPALVSCVLKFETGQISETEMEGAKIVLKNNIRAINSQPANNAPVQSDYF